ncbi:MAG: MFS transporter [Thaumarchaeota archaeon]|nr:MFS transporter [Nitrososphaerota archaeon]
MENRNALAAVIVLQFAAAINWYSFSSVFSLIAADLHQNVSGLGLITTTFVLGVALFQIPAGLVAARYGPRNALTLGALLVAVPSILIGLVDQVTLVTALRLVVGVGEAFIFGPGVVLVTRYFKKGSEGLGIGFYSAAFDLGGVVGISGWAALGVAVGWRVSMVAGGAIALGGCALLVLLVPKDPRSGAFSVSFSELKAVMLNKWLLIVSAGLITEQVCFSLNLYFMVYYLEESLRVVATVAGAIGGLTLAVSLLAGPLAGRAFDKSRSPKMTFIVLCFAATGGLAIAALASVYAALVSGFVVGIATAAAYIFGIGIARTIGGVREEYGALRISWINGIALLGGVWTPLVFAEIAAGAGYSLAWAITALLLVVVTLPVFLLRSENTSQRRGLMTDAK